MWSGLVPALRGDLFLMVRSKGLRLVVALPAVCALAHIGLGTLRQLETTAGGLVGGGVAASPEASGYGPFVDGVRFGAVVLYLAVLASAAYSIAFEREQGILRHSLIRRVSRPALVASKFVVLTAFSGMLAMLLLAAAWGTSAYFYDFVPIVEDGYELIGHPEIHEEIWRGMVLAFLPLPAAVGFGILVSVVARSAAQALALAVGASLSFDLFKGLLGDSAGYLYAAYHPSLVDQSYLGEVARIVRGYSDVFVEDAVLRLNQWVPIPQAILFVAMAMLIMQRRKV